MAVLNVLVALGCAPNSVTTTPTTQDASPARPVRVSDYQMLFDSLGDRCYAGDQFPTALGAEPFSDSRDRPRHSLTAVDHGPVHQLLMRAPGRFGNSTANQASAARQNQVISSVADVALLADIVSAVHRRDELIVIGRPARESDGLRPDDWHVTFRAIAGTEDPGVSIDPGPNPALMQVRYFGDIQDTDLGRTFFEADRTLKLLSTGFDNLTCARWRDLPGTISTELDLMSAEIGDGTSSVAGDGRWHRFWFEPSDNYLEVDGSGVLIPDDRLVVKAESIPAGLPSRNSTREFAASLTGNLRALGERIPAFRDLQRDAALVMLGKWLRDKELTVDERWFRGMPTPAPTPNATPSMTVLRARMTDRLYLRYGIHGGVDFQKANRYGPASARLRRLLSEVDRMAPPRTPSWLFDVDGQSYRAVRLRITQPAQLNRRPVVWQRTVSRPLMQPAIYRVLVPLSNFVVTNDTGQPLTLQFTGPFSRTERVPTGSPRLLRIVPGSYRLTITSGCGVKDDSVTVSEGARHQLRYWCEVQPAVPMPALPGVASFVVKNNTGAVLTVLVGGQSYSVPVGAMTIPLAAGEYTALITSRCGSTTETLKLQTGAVFTGQYSCIPK